MNSSSWVMLIRQNCIILSPPTVTARASSLSRSPWHLGQGAVAMHSSSSFRTESDWVSRNRREMLLRIPSKGCSNTPMPLPRL